MSSVPWATVYSFVFGGDSRPGKTPKDPVSGPSAEAEPPFNVLYTLNYSIRKRLRRIVGERRHRLAEDLPIGGHVPRDDAATVGGRLEKGQRHPFQFARLGDHGGAVVQHLQRLAELRAEEPDLLGGPLPARRDVCRLARRVADHRQGQRNPPRAPGVDQQVEALFRDDPADAKHVLA